LEEALSGAGVSQETPWGFGDEMRVGLRGMVRRVWGRRGVKVYQRLQLTYEWRYLFLMVNALAGKLHWCWLDSMAGEKVMAAVGGLKQHTEVAAVVWDGAPGHRDERVGKLGLPLIGLPSYSPELNPAERVFEEVRRAIEGKVYPTLKDKVAAVGEFLSRLEAEPERVRSLTCWDWIKASVQRLPIHYVA
jgi:transposase